MDGWMDITSDLVHVAGNALSLSDISVQNNEKLVKKKTWVRWIYNKIAPIQVHLKLKIWFSFKWRLTEHQSPWKDNVSLGIPLVVVLRPCFNNLIPFPPDWLSFCCPRSSLHLSSHYPPSNHHTFMSLMSPFLYLSLPLKDEEIAPKSWWGEQNWRDSSHCRPPQSPLLSSPSVILRHFHCHPFMSFKLSSTPFFSCHPKSPNSPALYIQHCSWLW